MRRVAGWAASALLAVVVCFQIALVAGAPWGRFTQGGAVEGALPAGGRILALASIAILALFWLGLSGRAGIGPARRWPRRLLAVVAWIATAYFVFAILVNAATPSAAERAVWLPVSVALLACAVVITWPQRAHDPN